MQFPSYGGKNNSFVEIPYLQLPTPCESRRFYKPTGMRPTDKA